MMHMNSTEIAAGNGGAIRFRASGALSFDAVLSGRLPAAI